MTTLTGQQKVFQMVTDRIIELLEQGTIPWRVPWAPNGGNVPVNWVTQKPYRGINRILLPFGGEYATAKQIKEAGGRIKSGERPYVIVFCKPVTIKPKEEDVDEEEKRFFVYRYYKVFEINTQCEGLKSKRPPVQTYDHDPIASAEAVVEGFKDKPKIVHASGRAVYFPYYDRISIPPLEDYKVKQEYYSTLFHELIHSTGHISRLNRDGVMGAYTMRDKEYAFEELVAEMGAAMLCTETGIEHKTIENSAAYIDHWLKRLRNDRKLIIVSARHAQRAFDYIIGTGYEAEDSQSA